MKKVIFYHFLHRNGRIIEEEYKDNGTYMVVEVDDEVYNKTQEYVTLRIIKDFN